LACAADTAVDPKGGGMIAVSGLVAIAIAVLALQGCTRYFALTRADSLAPI
jgi:hypothetical protein